MKNLLIILISLFAFNNIQAQGIMKDPVSFKLKNGVEVIVAENNGMGKILASVKMEGGQLASNTKVTMADKGKDFGPKVSFSTDEASVAADTEDFENAFLATADALTSASRNHGNLVPARTYITIAGDITLAQAKVLAKKAFGEWKENSSSELAK
ncbi:hypothetical protein SAMN05421820_103541 [Pedobacter steynii]|uniref:Preprotein translocase subunit SecD n=1 Tax=Pedobacter steynii TaxID=430522 RepID=A0A1G9SBM5_9SPHI|nr:hypothetical protein [Pedobacter steynii]NQX37475.1 hypothetical protein [Pedobacter steynii]SDM32874.1 hypothetical protein SAMN05421820_103541 [Pedobacter steynii]